MIRWSRCCIREDSWTMQNQNKHGHWHYRLWPIFWYLSEILKYTSLSNMENNVNNATRAVYIDTVFLNIFFFCIPSGNDVGLELYCDDLNRNCLTYLPLLYIKPEEIQFHFIEDKCLHFNNFFFSGKCHNVLYQEQSTPIFSSHFLVRMLWCEWFRIPKL